MHTVWKLVNFIYCILNPVFLEKVKNKSSDLVETISVCFVNIKKQHSHISKNLTLSESFWNIAEECCFS